MAVAIARPKLEGNIAVGDDRQIGFAEFGDPQGRAVFWLHGTPGARRQIPMEARVYAEQRQIRLIGLDRPGIGSSTPYQYDTVFAFADDLRAIADTLGIDKFEVIGLSGGGPFTLACAAAMPDRVVAAGVLGGIAPSRGADAIGGGVMAFGSKVAPVLEVAGYPIRLAAVSLVRLARPVASPALDLYGRLSPEADRHMLARPEFKAMFLDDLCSTAAASNSPRRSPTSWCSPATGASGSTRSRYLSAGGTGTATTSSRSSTASTSCPGCPTPSCITCPVKATWPD